ncbi:multidrug effflux MFS transporter [Thalassococcus lentus]|uniref:Bcr/CflA family efflux transporter n=1 Tax=Thalassococcus lentus TaxID=1210524 RepID=A0ABT4XR05_9RHOB|nr:multidrug effflux MFS transporter [Thalassococcus lentus]MDA7424376.1 multidrug effflux MFS transporter [Thalassococcus lentus]
MSEPSPSVPRKPGRKEFIALVAMMSALVALSVDTMLPGLPQMAQDLTPNDPNRAQLVVTSFVLGMGLGTLVTGPLSDSFGRKSVLLWGSVIYVASALACAYAQSMEALLIARLVQGLGAAGPRVVALALVRDRYAGRGMARIVSFVMIVFTTVPAIAPSLGALAVAYSSWRLIFWIFIVFAVVLSLWTVIRLPETLSPEHRRPFKARSLRAAVLEMLMHPTCRLSILVQGLGFGCLFATISTVQPIYDLTFDRAHEFHLWFGAIAVLAASASFLNAALVMRLGMIRLVSAMLLAQVVMSAVMIALLLFGVSGNTLFGLFMLWQLSLFFQAGLTIGNLNAIAMEPMGHIAGMAASVIGSLATIIAVILAVPIGLAFDGTPMPLAIGVFVLCALSLILMRRMRDLQDENSTL